MSKPVLNAIQQLLHFKDHTTVAEIARVSGLKQVKVLEVINNNGKYVLRIRQNGKITRLTHRQALRDDLWEAGKFFRSDEGNSLGDIVLNFKGHHDLRAKLSKTVHYGIFNDSYDRVQDTPENRKVLYDAGLVDEKAMAIDDSYWIEY